jgi:predicted flap endonuclease-1-like 5' DNA nuclease
MDDVEVKQAPLLAGWVIAAAVGLVAGAVAMVLMGFNVPQAAFVGVVLLIVVGLILGLPRSEKPDMATVPVVRAAPVAPVMATPAMAAPVMEVVEVEVVERPAASPIGRRPAALAQARGGVPDDLKQIKGVGPVLEQLLHSLGFYHFDQVANWTAEEVAWVDENLEGFKGRVTRDEWVAQAKILAAGGSTEFSRRVEDGEVY